MMARIIIVLTAGWLAACDVREVSESEDAPAEIQAALTDESSLKAVVEGLNTPSRYRVILEWKSELGMSLHRRQAHTPYQKLETTGNRFIDDTVVSGETYRYALFDPSQAGVSAAAGTEIEVKVPKDLVIDSPTAMREIRDYQRLFLTPSGVLQGKGTLRVEVKELHSEGGRIENRSSGAGLVFVEAERAVGKIVIVTLGNDGAPGRPGVAGLPGKKGANGEDGKLVGKNLPPALSRQLETLLTEKKRNLSDLSETDINALFECQKPPTDGEPGTKGGPGGNGERGENGHDSGKIWLKIRYADELHLSTIIESGKGGAGGKAGEGGRGGDGGDAGKDFFVCKKGKSGKKGENGEAGKSGDSGGSGVTLTPCLLLGATRVGDCETSPRL